MSTATEDLEEIDTDDAKPIVAFPNPPMEESPVRPLGFMGSHVVFGMPEGVIRIEAASKVGGMLRTDIFASFKGQQFLGHWKSPEDGKLQVAMAAVWFNRTCRDQGLWDSARATRKAGVWPGEDGGLVVHVGDAVRFDDGPWLTIAETFGHKGPIYERSSAVQRPGEPATVADALWIRSELDRWNWEEIGDEGLTGADVAFAWLAPSLLGAVAPFRGHGLVYGPHGSGKTSLTHLLQAATSALSAPVLNSFTAAGFRNGLASEAKPVFLDEAEESTDGNGPVNQALEFLRRMSTGDGGTHRMGQSGGGTIAQTLVGMVWLGAITPPRLQAADASRIVEVRLRPLGDAKAGGDDLLKAARERARELSPRLWARALASADRYRRDVAEMKGALGRASLAPRAADLMAMLAAGKRVWTHNDPLTPEEADEEVLFWMGMIQRREQEDSTQNPGAVCLSRLLSFDSGLQREGRRLTLGELVERERKTIKPTDGGDHEEALKTFGLRVSRAEGVDWLWVANNHPGLDRVFEGTRFADWKRTLSMLDGLGPDYAPRPGKKAARFGLGQQSRFIAVPLTPWDADPSGLKAAERPGPVTPSVPEELHDF